MDDRTRGSDGVPDVSIVIPVRNEATTIEAVIRGLLADPVDASLEVVVADGRSTDATPAILARLANDDPRVVLVDNPDIVTPAGLNAAIRASRGNVIVRMDGHAEPDPGFVASCLSVLRSSGAWNVGGRLRKIGRSRAGRAAAAATSSRFGIGGGDRYHTAEAATDVDTLWPGCWPRWVFERVGLFDPELVRAEDEELNQRILDAGGSVRFDPSISAGYYTRSTWGGLLRQYLGYGQAKVRVVQKRPSVLRVRHLVPAGFVAFVALSAVAGILWPLAWGLLAVAVVSWLLVAIASARSVARPFGSSLPDVVLAFACVHLGYGVGTWVGVVRYAPRWFVGRRGEISRLEPRTA